MISTEEGPARNSGPGRVAVMDHVETDKGGTFDFSLQGRNADLQQLNFRVASPEERR